MGAHENLKYFVVTIIFYGCTKKTSGIWKNPLFLMITALPRAVAQVLTLIIRALRCVALFLRGFGQDGLQMCWTYML